MPVLLEAVLIEIRQECLLAVWPQRDLALARPFPSNPKPPVLSIHIHQAERADFRDQQSCLQQDPEQGTIAHGGFGAQGTALAWRLAGQQHLVKYLQLDEVHARLFCLGQSDGTKRVAF
jgi:hypothetical protein